MKTLILLLAPAFLSAQTVREAKKFFDDAETKLFALNVEANRAAQVHANSITFGTEALFAAAYPWVTAEGSASPRPQPASIRRYGTNIPTDIRPC